MATYFAFVEENSGKLNGWMYNLSVADLKEYNALKKGKREFAKIIKKPENEITVISSKDYFQNRTTISLVTTSYGPSHRVISDIDYSQQAKDDFKDFNTGKFKRSDFK